MKLSISADDRELERLGPAFVFRTPSTSRPGLFHYISFFTNGRGIICSCEGFAYHKHCWHVDKIPLCLAPDAEGRQCNYLDQHEGAHAWEKTTES